MTEQNLQKIVVEKLSSISDFRIILDRNIIIAEHKTIRPDVVVSYGDKPFAIIEFKAKSTKQAAIDYFCTLTRIIPSFKCYIANVDGQYLYYNIENDDIIDSLTFEDALGMLEKAISKGEDAGDFADALKDEVERISMSKCFNNAFLKYLRKDTLKRYGKYLYLDVDYEIEMMRELLNYNQKDNDRLCRYMSAEGLFETLLHKSFRMKSTDAMNDALETKVIEQYDNLKVVKTFLNEYIYNGFILSFSALEREDKLFNWYMYGDRGKGVCITIKRKEAIEKSEDVFLFAPVVYIPLKSLDDRKSKFTLLDYLNEIMSLKVPIDSNVLEFRLKLWHYWKYFFKYDFYEDEEETRLLCITKKKGSYSWQGDYKLPYTYIDSPFGILPFEISDCCVGPNYNGNGLVDDVFPKISNNEINFKSSVIVGFRG